MPNAAILKAIDTQNKRRDAERPRWKYSIREACTPHQFSVLKFEVLPRYKHQASYSRGIVTINIASQQAARTIGQSLGLEQIALYEPAGVL